MKSIACASLAALLLVSLALPSLTLASADGPSASGSFQFSLDDGQIRNLEFNARVQNNGRTVGEMTFSDQAAIPVPDPDDSTAINSPGAVMTAKFDCLQIEGNRAVISQAAASPLPGMLTSSSARSGCSRNAASTAPGASSAVAMTVNPPSSVSAAAMSSRVGA